MGSISIRFEKTPVAGRSEAFLNNGVFFREHEKSPESSGLEWAERGRAVLFRPESNAGGNLFLCDIRDLNAGGWAVFWGRIIALSKAR